jgi:hypothetical protein
LFSATTLAAVAWVSPLPVLGQERVTLSGSWTASALSESWSFTSWGEACGPKPRPQGAGGGTTQIREQGGELSIVGAGRAFSTAECWEQMPGLSRTSHSQSGGGRFWRTRCSTPSSDPRRATIVTTIQASDSAISLNETGQYEFRIMDAACTASVSRSRSWSLVRRDGDAPPAASASASASAVPSAAAPPVPAPVASTDRSAPPPPRTPVKTCVSAGEPARLEVHPARKLMRPGERFAFRAIVLDAEGCAVAAKPTWHISPGPLATKATVDAAGSVAVAADAGEGRIELVASIGGKGVPVGIEVASAEHYDALLATQGLNADGELDQAAVAVIATGTVGGRTAVGDDVGRERKRLFVAIVAGLAACLALVGFILARRGKKPQLLSGPEDDEAWRDGENGPEVSSEPGEPLADVPPPVPSRPSARAQICPTCGGRFDTEAVFCGKDGTKLVPLNLGRTGAP